jgi:hypothetical protein
MAIRLLGSSRPQVGSEVCFTPDDVWDRQVLKCGARRIAFPAAAGCWVGFRAWMGLALVSAGSRLTLLLLCRRFGPAWSWSVRFA